ncbi:MAG: hypothetical protein ABJE47_07620 [bacterium]
MVAIAVILGSAAALPAGAQAPVATVFAPGRISGPANDADAAFTPDGDTIYFSRNSTIMVAHRTGATWSTPAIASFSGTWNDQQPTMAPSGAFMVFVSNRPIQATDATRPLGNMWRVNRVAGRWSEPTHLPAAINRDNSTWAPSIAGDGSVYFMERAAKGAPFRLWRSQYQNGEYLAATPVFFGDSTTQDVDPAVAPDESFIVFGSMHLGPNEHERLFIAFKENGAWSRPVDLGDSVNGPDDTNEARLSPDHRTLYFSGTRTTPIRFPRTRAQAAADLARIESWDNGNLNIWSVPLATWLDARHE